LKRDFDNIKTWSDMYDECDLETKKMILFHMMKKVHIRRDYEIELDLMVDIEQLGLLGGTSLTGEAYEKALVP